MAPHYVHARQDERPVMQFDSVFQQQQPHDEKSSRPFHQQFNSNSQSSSEHFQPQNFQLSNPQEQSQHQQQQEQQEQKREQPFVTDYGAHRTNDASSWYLRQFKSQEGNSSPNYNGEEKEEQQGHLNHHQQEQQNKHSIYPEEVNSFNNHLQTSNLARASSDRFFNNNNDEIGNYDPEIESQWKTHFPSSDEFNSAFNSVISGGDPEAKDSMRQMQRSKGFKEPSTTQEPLEVKSNYEYSKSNVDSGFNIGQNLHEQGEKVFTQPTSVTSAPTSSASTSTSASSSSQRNVQEQPREQVIPIMYEPFGFPRRFYRLQL